MVIVDLVFMLLVIFGYPYVVYKLLKLKQYGFGTIGIGAQHWILNIILLLAPHPMCIGSGYEPIREVFIASQFAFWVPVLIIRYWRKAFTRMDRIWVRGAYPLVFIGFYISIYIYADVFRDYLIE
jgi:hypothetical protein